MNYANNQITRLLPLDNLQTELSSILDALESCRIIQIELLFGFAWGNEYLNWEPIRVRPEQMSSEIQKAETTSSGKFGKDDLFITLVDEPTQVLFCHEGDIHLSYDETTEFVKRVIGDWQQKQYITD